MSDACVDQWLEQSIGNRKTWARIPAQSKASFFHRKILKFFKYLNNKIRQKNFFEYLTFTCQFRSRDEAAKLAHLTEGESLK